MLKQLLFILLIPSFQLKAQTINCTLKPPAITVHFGTGNIIDLNAVDPYHYRRITHYCPSDGNYAYTPYTSNCFRSDWITLEQDHTAGDASGNMMLVNASYQTGIFFSTQIPRLKPATKYEFAVWMVNLCKVTEKCPFPLLPNISILLQTTEGKTVSQLQVGQLVRDGLAQWSQFKVFFTTPPGDANLVLNMINSSPGGCGNDFAMDDITFRECVPIVTTTKKTPVVAKKEPTVTKPVVKKETVTAKPVAKKETPVSKPAVKKQTPAAKPIVKTETPATTDKQIQSSEVAKPKTDSAISRTPVVKQKPPAFVPLPSTVAKRENALIKKIETSAGEIKIDLYDNGEIDGDTVTIYHNNVLLVSRQRLSQKPITFRIAVDASQPHHELIMVANNLGSIPPNTSLMIVTAGTKRYEVYISSNEQKNAKVVLDLKE